MRLQEIKENEEKLVKKYDQTQNATNRLNRSVRMVGATIAVLLIILFVSAVGVFAFRDQLLGTDGSSPTTIGADPTEVAALQTDLDQISVALTAVPPTAVPLDIVPLQTQLDALQSKIEAIDTRTAPTSTLTPSPTPTTIEANIQPEPFLLGADGNEIQGVTFVPNLSPISITLPLDWQFMNMEDEIVGVTNSGGINSLALWIQGANINEAVTFRQQIITPTTDLLLLPPALSLPVGTYSAQFALGQPENASYILGEPISLTINTPPITVTALLTENFRLLPGYYCSPCEFTYLEPVNSLGYIQVPYTGNPPTTTLAYDPFEEFENYMFSIPEGIEVRSYNETAPIINTTLLSGTQEIFDHPSTYFILVQIPNERQLYWLAEKDIRDFYDSDRWREIIDQLVDLSQ